MPTTPSRRATGLVIEGAFENLMAESTPVFDFPDFDEDLRAKTFILLGQRANQKQLLFLIVS